MKKLFALLLVSTNAFAAGNPFQSGVDGVIGFFTGGLSVSLAILGCIVLGLLGLFQKLSWERVKDWMIGIFLIFGAPSLVATLSGWVA